MPELACELHVFDITRCGLYNSREKEAKHLGVKDLFNEMKVWAIDSGKPLIETSTYSPNKRFLESFCLGVAENKGQYLLMLWNKVPHSKSGVGMVNGSTSPKSAVVSHVKVGKNDIPGYPTFFWILPSSKKIVAIRLENPSFGVGQLREYINGYLKGFCSYRVDRVEEGREIEGYSDFPAKNVNDDRRIINRSLRPHFAISAKKIPGKQREIKNQYAEITKLVKDIFIYNHLSDVNAPKIEKLRSWFNGLSPAKKKKIRIQMPVVMTREDVSDLMKLYADSDHSEEHDVGFVFKGQSGHIEWLSGSSKKEEATINIEWIADNQPNIDKLLKSLQMHEHLISSDDSLGEQEDAEAS